MSFWGSFFLGIFLLELSRGPGSVGKEAVAWLKQEFLQQGTNFMLSQGACCLLTKQLGKGKG